MRCLLLSVMLFKYQPTPGVLHLHLGKSSCSFQGKQHPLQVSAGRSMCYEGEHVMQSLWCWKKPGLFSQCEVGQLEVKALVCSPAMPFMYCNSYTRTQGGEIWELVLNSGKQNNMHRKQVLHSHLCLVYKRSAVLPLQTLAHRLPALSSYTQIVQRIS